MNDATAPFYDLYVTGFEVSDGTTVTGRINQEEPRIVMIDSGKGMSAKLAAQLATKHELINVDYSDLEERVISHMIQTPKDEVMDEMEHIYRYQQEAMKERYFEERQKHGLGRKNPRAGSRTAKDHRSATKLQRAARKKNRKK